MITTNEILTEEWRDVVGFENYQVSNMGRIYSKFTNKYRKPVLHKSGYYHIALQAKDGAKRFKMIHCLVMAAFVGPVPDGMEVDHVNCDKADNRLINLEYVTPNENIRRAIKNGRIGRIGIDNPRATLTEDEVRQIRLLLHKVKIGESNMQHKDIAALFGIKKNTVGNISSGGAWSHIQLNTNELN